MWLLDRSYPTCNRQSSRAEGGGGGGGKREGLPDEVGAVAAEGGLLEEAGCELMVFHLNNPLVFERTLPLEDRNPGWRGEGRG